MTFCIAQPPLDSASFLAELCNGVSRVFLQRFLAGEVARQRSVEPVELRKPPRNRVAAGARCCELVRERMALLPKLADRLAFVRQLPARVLVRGLGFGALLLDALDLFRRLLRLHGRGLGRSLGIGPTHMKKPRLNRTDWSVSLR